MSGALAGVAAMSRVDWVLSVAGVLAVLATAAWVTTYWASVELELPTEWVVTDAERAEAYAETTTAARASLVHVTRQLAEAHDIIRRERAWHNNYFLRREQVIDSLERGLERCR